MTSRAFRGNLDPNSHMYGLYRFKSGFRGSMDELAGEFDYIYSPLRKKLTDTAISLRARDAPPPATA